MNSCKKEILKQKLHWIVIRPLLCRISWSPILLVSQCLSWGYFMNEGMWYSINQKNWCLQKKVEFEHQNQVQWIRKDNPLKYDKVVISVGLITLYSWDVNEN